MPTKLTTIWPASRLATFNDHQFRYTESFFRVLNGRGCRNADAGQFPRGLTAKCTAP